jgi:hypothetical protein
LTPDPQNLVAITITALEQMAPVDRALAAAALIAAVQGEGDRPIARIRWAAIAEMHDTGRSIDDIACDLAATPGSVDLAIQSHRRYGTKLAVP